MLNYLNYYFRTNLLFICIVYVLIVLFCSLYFNDSLLCEDHPVEGGSGSYSESELFGKDNNDSLSEEDRVKEFVRMCDMTSSNYYSADYYRCKIFELERDEELFFKFEKLSWISDKDMTRRKFLIKYVSKKKLDNNEVRKYIEFKKNLYASEVNIYYENASVQSKIVWEWLRKYPCVRKVDLSKYKFFGYSS